MKTNSCKKSISEVWQRGSDPKWCLHARAMIKALEELLQVLNGDPAHCHVSQDKIGALTRSTDGMKMHAQGCP